MNKLVALLIVMLCVGAGIYAWRSSGHLADVREPAKEPLVHSGKLIENEKETDKQIAQPNGGQHNLPAFSDVTSAFKTTDNYYTFARAVAGPAMTGDARAAYYLSIVLEQCRSFIGLIKTTGETSAETALSAFQEKFPGLPTELREAQKSLLQQCKGFFDADPLDQLPPQFRQRQPIEWLKASYEGGDVLAGTDYTSRAIAGNLVTGADREKLLDRDLPQLLQKAAASKDPRLIAAVGRLFMYPDLQTDALQGVSWLLAACDMGFDCAMANRELGLPCAQSNSCEPGSNVVDWLRTGLTPSQFANAYANAQDIRFRVKSGDMQSLKKYLTVKRS